MKLINDLRYILFLNRIYNILQKFSFFKVIIFLLEIHLFFLIILLAVRFLTLYNSINFYARSKLVFIVQKYIVK